jgi:hypothetical protein
MSRHRAVLLSVLLLLGAATQARAQTAQRWSVQLSALYATVGASVFEEVENGPGVEGQLRLTKGSLSVGVGGQFTRHGVQSDVIGDMNLYGAFLEPRYVIALQSNRFAPYVSGRISYLRGTLDGAEGTVESNGAQFNAGGGILVNLNSRVNLDLGATYGRLNFGRLTKTIDDVEFEEDGGGGGNLVLRVGFAFGLGGGAP